MPDQLVVRVESIEVILGLLMINWYTLLVNIWGYYAFDHSLLIYSFL
jgi:hypothetical protein